MKKTLADRMAFLISTLGVKNPDFARRIQYTHSYICMVLSGAKPNPGHRFINAVCREFNVNSEWLVNGKEPVFTVPGLPLPPERAEVLSKFLMLSSERQNMIEEMIDAFLVKDMTKREDKEDSRKGKK